MDLDKNLSDIIFLLFAFFNLLSETEALSLSLSLSNCFEAFDAAFTLLFDSLTFRVDVEVDVDVELEATLAASHLHTDTDPAFIFIFLFI